MTRRLLEVAPSISPRKQREAQKPGADSDHWFTPMKLFRPLYKELRFTIDAAGHPEAPVSQIIGRWHGIREDGLAQSYEGERVWCNPPYSDIAPWCDAAVRWVGTGADLCALLLPCWTDRAWWHDFIEPCRVPGAEVAAEVRFIRGRVRYGYPGNPEGLGQHGGGFDPSVVVVLRPRIPRWSAAMTG